MFKKLIILLFFAFNINICATELESKSQKEKSDLITFILDVPNVMESNISILLKDSIKSKKERENFSINSFKTYKLMMEWFPFTSTISYQNLLHNLAAGLKREIFLDELDLTFKDNSKFTFVPISLKVESNKTYMITDSLSELSNYIIDNYKNETQIIHDQFDKNDYFYLMIIDGLLNIAEIKKSMQQNKAPIIAE